MKRGHGAEGRQAGRQPQRSPTLIALVTGRTASGRRSGADAGRHQHVSAFADGCFSTAAYENRREPGDGWDSWRDHRMMRR